MIHRTTEQFNQALLKGLQVEEDFAEKVALMGGHATPFGPPPVKKIKGESNKPLTFCKNYIDEVTYFPSPDLLIDFPNFAGKVQVKSKKIQRKGTNDAHFVLDEKEKCLMERSNLMALPTLFVVHCEDLKFDPHLDSFSFLDVADLHPDLNRLHRRIIFDKPTFALPLRMFRSFNVENINRLGRTYDDSKRCSHPDREDADPRYADQARPGPNEGGSRFGNSCDYAVA